MANPTTVTTPDFTGVIDQAFFLRPLGGPDHPETYLDRFPEEVYTHSIDSHLVRFLYVLMGPAGVGWLKKNYLEARLKLEDFGLETFDLDKFYGDPLRFGRILEEVYDTDPSGMIPRDKWEEIRAKDAKYRNRAVDFVNAARAGGTPLGMRLAARSGLGHEVEVFERYRYLYDQVSDRPLGIPDLGMTNSTEELVVIPRRELPQSEVQIVTAVGDVTGGTYKLYFPVGNEASNSTANITYDATAGTIQLLLEDVVSNGQGNVLVTGGPIHQMPLEILFTGALAHRDVPQLQAISSLTGPSVVSLIVSTKRSGVDQLDEVVSLSDRDKRHVREALKRIKPVTTIVTYDSGRGTKATQTWNQLFATSANHYVARYVTGNNAVTWPAVDDVSWIESGVEKEAPRTNDDIYHNYCGFHRVASIFAYDEDAVADPGYLDDLGSVAYNPNVQQGAFNSYQVALYPVLAQVAQGYEADRAPADYAEPLNVRSHVGDTAMINGMYPIEYQNLPGVPALRYRDDQFWASRERSLGDDYLEIDLGSVKAVNYLYFEVTRKPYNIEIAFDLLDLAPEREWAPVTFEQDAPHSTNIGYSPNVLNPWQTCEFFFENAQRRMIFTRYLRIRFSRRNEETSPFWQQGSDPLPYSIEVRNLRIGRNVT